MWVGAHIAVRPFRHTVTTKRKMEGYQIVIPRLNIPFLLGYERKKGQRHKHKHAIMNQATTEGAVQSLFTLTIYSDLTSWERTAIEQLQQLFDAEVARRKLTPTTHYRFVSNVQKQLIHEPRLLIMYHDLDAYGIYRCATEDGVLLGKPEAIAVLQLTTTYRKYAT